MKTNFLIKVLCSLPVILLGLYFIPFVGICLLILRYFIYSNRNKLSTYLLLIGMGVLVYVPKLLYSILDVIKYDGVLNSYLDKIVNSNLYSVDLINYGKFIIIVGVIFLIISVVLKQLLEKVIHSINGMANNYISKSVESNAKISKENDMEIKVKQEKAKNTTYIKCPKCGADNIISEQFGECKYCRSKLVNKKYK